MNGNLPTHGPWCGSRTFPCDCRYCGAGIYFFSCVDHGSVVLFDDLGSPWPKHECPSGARQGPRKKKGSVFVGSLDNGYAESIRGHRARVRDTVKVEPALGESPTLLGVVDFVEEFSAFAKLRLQPGVLAADRIVKKFGNESVAQITVRVDELDVNPDARDFRSYTFWLSTAQSANVAKGDIVSAALFADALLMSAGVPWIARSLDVLM